MAPFVVLAVGVFVFGLATIIPSVSLLYSPVFRVNYKPCRGIVVSAAPEMELHSTQKDKDRLIL